MARTFVPWSEDLRADVAAAFGAPTHWTVEQGRSGWRQPTDGECWSRAVVLMQAACPAAVASAFHPTLHPRREWCYVEVASASRGRGCGRAALAELRRQLPPHAGPLRSKVRAGSPGDRFARRHGLQPIQRTRRVRVRVPNDWPSGGDHGLRAAQVAVDEVTTEVWSRYYLAGHDWDPPGNVPTGRWGELLDATAERVLVARRGDEILGIALLGSGEGSRSFVGGAVDRYNPEAVEIADCLLAEAADLSDGRWLDVELDDWMWEIGRSVDRWQPETVDEAYVVAEPVRRGADHQV